MPDYPSIDRHDIYDAFMEVAQKVWDQCPPTEEVREGVRSFVSRMQDWLDKHDRLDAEEALDD